MEFITKGAISEFTEFLFKIFSIFMRKAIYSNCRQLNLILFWPTHRSMGKDKNRDRIRIPYSYRKRSRPPCESDRMWVAGCWKDRLPQRQDSQC